MITELHPRLVGAFQELHALEHSTLMPVQFANAVNTLLLRDFMVWPPSMGNNSDTRASTPTENLLSSSKALFRAAALVGIMEKSFPHC